MPNHKDRLRKNAESKTKAFHDKEPWSANEDEFLQVLWDGAEETLADIAELLGRTIEACRERYYKVRRMAHVVYHERVVRTTIRRGDDEATIEVTERKGQSRPAWMDEEGLPDWYR